MNTLFTCPAFLVAILLLIADACASSYGRRIETVPKVIIALTRASNMNHKLNHELILRNSQDTSFNRNKCEIECIELPCIKCEDIYDNINILPLKLPSYDAVLVTSPKVRKLFPTSSVVWIGVLL